ncbi:MAG: type II secretion system protein GspD [Phycisphaerales bacterium]
MNPRRRSFRGSRPHRRGGIRGPHAGAAVLAAILAGGAPAIAWAQVGGGTAAEDDARTILTGRVELVRIVDLACQRRGITVRYDPQEVKGTVTIRSGDRGLTTNDLWDLMQRSLAKEGLTTVFEPGDRQLQVVRLADAGNAARLDLDGVAPDQAGFATILLPVRHAPIEEIVGAVRDVLSKPSGRIRRLSESSDLVLLSELETRLPQTLALIELLDAPRAEPVVVRVAPDHVAPAELVQQVSMAAAAREGLTGRKLPGVLIPMLDGSAALLVAPPESIDTWRSLIAEFDTPQAVTTRTYRPAAHGNDEVALLIEESARINGPRGAGQAWRIVRDSITESLIVTATPAEHEAIAALLKRLETHAQATGGTTTDIRRIRIRNRDLGDLHATLTAMVQAGVVLDVPRAPRGGPDRSTDRRAGTPNARSAGAGRGGSVATGRSGLDRTGGPGRSSSSTGADPAARLAAGSGNGGGNGAATGSGTAIRVSETEDLTITADAATGSIILMGPPRQLDRIERLILDLDVREPQVMLEVVVVNLSDADMLDFGIELQKVEVSGGTLSRLASLFGLSDVDVNDADAANLGRGQGGTGLVLSPGDFAVVIRALQSVNQGRTLVSPKVLVNNGEQALLDSIRREPVQSTNASNTVATTSFAGTVDAGTQLTLTPQIAEGDHLILQYEVTLSTFVGDSADPSLPPPRQENALSSVVTLPDGHTIVLGGLDSITESEARSQVPVLGDIPLVGELFRNRSTTSSRSRFFVFVRPTIMRHAGFEDLRFATRRDRVDAGIDDGWPAVRPRIIK